MSKTAEIVAGTILIHSIGCGHDNFYQVVERKPSSVKARRLKAHHNFDVKTQTSIKTPLVGQFEDKNCYQYEVMLRIKTDRRGDLQIGPIKRLIWWNVWDGEPRLQYSS